MPPVRVFIVDDAAAVRGMVRLAVQEAPDMTVAGMAANGALALKALATTPADVVVLDVEMPQMDGLATVKALRERFPGLPVVMFSTLTESGAAVTVQALLAGARAYATKPTGVASPEEGLQVIRETLLPKIRGLCPRGGTTEDIAAATPSPATPPAPRSGKPPAGPPRARLVAVGSSTGGPAALVSLLSALPGDFPAPVVVVQHMPPVFTHHLARRLDEQLPLPVVEASGGEWLRAPGVWLAPGGKHLVMEQCGGWRLRVKTGPPVNFCQPSVDVLFDSVAQAVGNEALAVVLTGMGSDGLEGARHLVQRGAEVVVQDQGSSVVWGMPGAVAKAGLATLQLPPEALGVYVRSRVPYVTLPGGIP